MSSASPPVGLPLFDCRTRDSSSGVKVWQSSFLDQLSCSRSRSSFGSVYCRACVLSSSINGFVTRSLCRKVKYTSQLPSAATAVKQIFSQQLHSCATRWLRWCCWHSARVTVQDVLQWKLKWTTCWSCEAAWQVWTPWTIAAVQLQSCVCLFILDLFSGTWVIQFCSFSLNAVFCLASLKNGVTLRINLWIIEWLDSDEPWVHSNFDLSACDPGCGE